MTNWENAAEMQCAAPHTFQAMQALVMAFADFAGNIGKKSLFGQDKGRAAYKKVEVKLLLTMAAMEKDGIIKRDSSPAQIRMDLVRLIDLFAEAFPNWPDAYGAAHGVLVNQSEYAEERIRQLLQ